MLPFSKGRLNHNGSVIIQLVSGSGEAQDLKLVNYVFAGAATLIKSHGFFFRFFFNDILCSHAAIVFIWYHLKVVS